MMRHNQPHVFASMNMYPGFSVFPGFVTTKLYVIICPCLLKSLMMYHKNCICTMLLEVSVASLLFFCFKPQSR